MNHNARRKLFSLLFALVFSNCFCVLAFANPASFKKGNTIDPDLHLRQYMIEISQDLGKTCEYCHNVSNFRDKSKSTYKISKEHMRVTRVLNEEGFKWKPKVSCWVCHKGQTKPEAERPQK